MFSLSLILFPIWFYAQTYSLKDCISYGLKNSPRVAISANSEAIAEAQKKQALSRYLPNISANGSITDNIEVPVNVIPAGVISDEDMTVAFTKQYATSGTIELNQPIYNQSLLTGLKAGKYLEEQASLNKRKTDEELIYTISNAYYQVGIYRLQLDLLQSDKSIYEEQLRIAAVSVAKGVMSISDQNRIEVNYNAILSQLHTASGNLDFSLLQLKNAMGFPISKSLEINPSQDLNMEMKLPQEEVDSTFIMNHQTNYLLDEVNISLLDIDAKQTKASVLPSLSFFAKYGTNGFGDNFNQSFEQLNNFSAD